MVTYQRVDKTEYRVLLLVDLRGPTRTCCSFVSGYNKAIYSEGYDTVSFFSFKLVYHRSSNANFHILFIFSAEHYPYDVHHCPEAYKKVYN